MYITRNDAPSPYMTGTYGSRKTHGWGLAMLAQANLQIGGGAELDESTREAILEGYCCADAKRTNWHGKALVKGPETRQLLI